MKNQTLLFLFVICISYTNAQTWFPDSAKWYYRIPQSGIREYKIIKDTLIFNKTVKIVEVAYINGVITNRNVYDTVYVYEENNRVYYLDNTEYKLMYDFNLTKGDTLHAEIDGQDEFCGYDSYVTIDSVYNKTIKDIDLNFQILTHTSEFGNVFEAEVLETIGSNSFIYKSIPSCVSITPAEEMFFCYEDQNLILNQNYNLISSCDSLINSIEHDISSIINNIICYPNPIRDELTIEINREGNYELEIYDVHGKHMYSTSMISTNQFKINFDKLISGVYYIKIHADTNNDAIFTSKLIKE